MKIKLEESNFGLIFWNIVNTCGMLLLFFWVLCIQDIPLKCDKRVTDMEQKFEIYENMKLDSIIIHVHNQINVPTPKVIKTTNSK